MDYAILNSIQALFHQGYVNIFGATSAALYKIVFLYLKGIHHWWQEDLNLVLFLEDELYESLKTHQYLSATDLLTNIAVCNVQV